MQQNKIEDARKLRSYGLSYRKIADMIESTKTTVQRWLSGYEDKTKIKKETRKQQVIDCLKSNPDFVVRDVASFCNISVGTSFNTLKEIGYSKKKSIKWAQQI